MFILNKKTGVVQECHNKDVIKICQKNPEEYEVAENREVLNATGETVKVSKAEQETKSLSEMKVAELRELAKEQGIDAADSLNKPELLEVLKDVV